MRSRSPCPNAWRHRSMRHLHLDAGARLPCRRRVALRLVDAHALGHPCRQACRHRCSLCLNWPLSSTLGRWFQAPPPCPLGFPWAARQLVAEVRKPRRGRTTTQGMRPVGAYASRRVLWALAFWRSLCPQMLFHCGHGWPHGLDRGFQLVWGHTQLFRPVTKLVVLMNVDAGSVLTAGLSFVVCHRRLLEKQHQARCRNDARRPRCASSQVNAQSLWRGSPTPPSAIWPWAHMQRSVTM